ncbi:MAG: hypothetical protein RRY22_02260 [Bacilli bacterium]
MKKDNRNYNPAMPMYGMPMPAPMPMPNYMNEQNVHEELMNLEKRVSRLEGIVAGNNMNPNYSESNFYMI